MSEAPASAPAADSTIAELLNLRNAHTRVWEIVREVETTHPDGSTTVDTVKSYIHEKASGLCYKDATGAYVPSVAEWRETTEGFVIDRCAYRLAMGKTIGTAARYTVEGNDLLLCPAYLIISDGVNESDPRPLNPETLGSISPDNPSVLRFPSAFGEGYDLEYVAEKGGFHQNLIISNPPEIAEGLHPDTTFIHLCTELNLDQYLSASGCEVTVEGEPVTASAADLVTEPSRGGCISFNKNGRLLHAFSVSQVTDSSGPGALDKQTTAEKRLIKDPSSGKAYLVESVPVSYFTDSCGSYPITWDYQNITEPISGGTWDPRFTYRVSGNISIEGTLTILPGTTVKLDPSKKITIVTNGTVIARGEPYNYITFTRTRDNNCGEIITGPADQAYDRALEILSGSTPNSAVQYCKFGGGSLGIYLGKSLTEWVKHNIFNGMTTGISIVSCTAIVHNNLIAYCSYLGILGYGASIRTFSNNTIDHCSEGIWDTGSTSLTIKDNLFTYCTVGISTDNYNAVISYNGFYQVSGGQTGSPAVQLTADPYASSGIGNYFLDDEVGGGAALKNVSSRTAAQAGLAGAVFTVEPPVPVSSGTHTGGETWSKVATDTGNVDIGYHHNGVDRYVAGDITFSGTGASLTIEPGVSVAFLGQAFSIDETAKLTCVGDPLDEGYNILTNSRSASMLIQSPRFASQTSPSLYIYHEAADDVAVRFTKIAWFAYGLRTFRAAPGCCMDNIFSVNRYGFVSDRCTNTLANNVFHRNWYGVMGIECDCECYGNTFDTNRMGLRYQRASGRTLTATTNLFTDFTPAGLLPASEPQGISLDGPPQGDFVHDFNAFYGNTYNIYDDHADEEVTIGDYSRDLLASPYHEKNTGWDAGWLLKQTPDPGEEPEEVLAVNGGPCAASEAGMDEFTTSWGSDRDEGTVDIGFHYLLNYQYVDLRATDLFGNVAASREIYDGAYVHYNIDDDNASGDYYVGDYTEQQVDNEDDLKLLHIAISDSIAAGTVVLTRNNAAVQVWKQPYKGAGNGVLTGATYQAGVEGNGKKTWDMSDPDQRDDVAEPLYVEGRASGTALLTVTYTNGQTQVSDTVTYTLIAATCGWQPTPQRRAVLEGRYPGLVGCEWSVTGPRTPACDYDCVAWSVGVTDEAW